MARVLRTDVHVVGSKGTLDFVVLPAGSEVPEEYADQVTAESAYVEEPEAEETDEAEGPKPYGEWTVEQLEEELVKRELPKSGKKAELVARLEDADAHPDDE